jgi:hypothetical protein
MYALVTLLLAAIAIAAPLETRANGSNGATCGSNKYTAAQVASATSAGYNLLEEGETLGSDDYVSSN